MQHIVTYKKQYTGLDLGLVQKTYTRFLMKNAIHKFNKIGQKGRSIKLPPFYLFKNKLLLIHRHRMIKNNATTENQKTYIQKSPW